MYIIIGCINNCYEIKKKTLRDSFIFTIKKLIITKIRTNSKSNF